MPAAVETMAYRGEVPWHGLGFKVEGSMSPEQMLEAASLGWEVHRVPLMMDLGNEVQSKLDSHFALGRYDGKKFRDSLGICGKGYVPVQNAQAFKFFKDFTDAGEMEMETAGSLQGGRYIWGMAKIKAGFKVAGIDEIKGNLLLMSPHIWGKSLVVMFCATRVVCMNTLTAALGESGDRFRAPHVREFDAQVADEAKKALGIANSKLQEIGEQFEFLAQTKISQTFTSKYVAELFQPILLAGPIGNLSGKDRLKAMLNDKIAVESGSFNRSAAEVLSCVNKQPGAELPSSAGTMFGALNAVTYFIDHRAGKGRDNALTAAWLGTGARLKRQALENAMVYARGVKR